MTYLLVVGLNPSLKSDDNTTLSRLARWMDKAGVRHWSFVNVASAPGRYVPSNVDRHFLWKTLVVSEHQEIVALGREASIALWKFNTRHLKLPHPSPLNRQLNDPRVEELAIARLREISGVYNHVNS